MLKPVADMQGRRLPSLGFAVALTVIGVYFGLILVPTWWPGIAGTFAYFLYGLSIPVVLLGLVGVALWGIGGAIAARRRGASASKQHRAVIALSLASFVSFASAVTLTRTIRSALPTGSHLLAFAPEVWLDSRSSQFVGGDITPRQKMLGSLVKQFRASQSRVELEAILGPSLQTPYFGSTGRDLIYRLGPERDSFFAIDSEWLLIWLDRDHFERFEIYTD